MPGTEQWAEKPGIARHTGGKGRKGKPSLAKQLDLSLNTQGLPRDSMPEECGCLGW